MSASGSISKDQLNCKFVIDFNKNDKINGDLIDSVILIEYLKSNRSYKLILELLHEVYGITRR